jgi:hypothetical protein
MIDEPTATQNLEVGQATDPSAPNAEGNVGTVHVEPSFADTRSSPAYGPDSPGATPTLTHVVVVGHVTPSSVVLLVGTVEDIQVLPPSLDFAVAP